MILLREANALKEKGKSVANNFVYSSNINSDFLTISDLKKVGKKNLVVKLIPYSKQTITSQDIKEVSKALRSDFLTTGPRVASF